MRNIFAVASLAALATSATLASAQTVGITIDIDEPVLAPGDSTTVRLVAHFPASDYAVAGVLTQLGFTGLEADPREHWSDIGVLAPFSTGPSGPRLGPTAIEGILAGQLNFPPAGIYADPTNPIAFFEATFTAPPDAGGGYRVDLSTLTGQFDVYIDRESTSVASYLGVMTEGRASIFVVPAPASAAVLALGLAATRGRRARIA